MKQGVLKGHYDEDGKWIIERAKDGWFLTNSPEDGCAKCVNYKDGICSMIGIPVPSKFGKVCSEYSTQTK